jgi:hypothetical protein
MGWGKGAGSVAFVVIRENQPGLAGRFETLVERAAHRSLSSAERHRHAKLLKQAHRKDTFQQTVKFRQRLVVKRHNSTFPHRPSSFRQQRLVGGKPGMYFSRETFLLCGSNSFAIHYEAAALS